jgi:hypothetical protein
LEILDCPSARLIAEARSPGGPPKRYVTRMNVTAVQSAPNATQRPIRTLRGRPTFVRRARVPKIPPHIAASSKCLGNAGNVPCTSDGFATVCAKHNNEPDQARARSTFFVLEWEIMRMTVSNPHIDRKKVRCTRYMQLAPVQHLWRLEMRSLREYSTLRRGAKDGDLALWRAAVNGWRRVCRLP